MIVIFLFLVFLLANVVVLLRTSHQATRWDRGPKLALGVGPFVLGQLTINVALVVIPNILLGTFPAIGSFLRTAIGAVVAGLWLCFGLHWLYGFAYRRLGGEVNAAH